MRHAIFAAALALALALTACATPSYTPSDVRTYLVRADSPLLHGAPSWYDSGRDAIYIDRDHPIADCLTILKHHEEIHRQQYYRGEDIHTARAEREAREGSMSWSCTDAGRAPVFKALVDTMQ